MISCLLLFSTNFLKLSAFLIRIDAKINHFCIASVTSSFVLSLWKLKAESIVTNEHVQVLGMHIRLRFDF